MAQLPDVEDTNNNSLMDDAKVNTTSPYEQPFDDNDSLKNHVDSNEIGMDDIHHSIIQNRDNAPPPPSSLTMASLQHFNDENPPQNMLVSTNLIEERSGGNSSQPIPDLGLGEMLGSFAHNTHNVPAMLIDPLIEMGFNRKKAIYALQQSERMINTMSVEYALQWLFENPTFEVPNTGNITATINHMLGATKSNNNENNTDPLPPNNSPKAIESHDANTTDTFLYDLMETATASHALTNNNNSKSNRIYKHSGTLASAATEEEKHTHHTTSTMTSELSALSVDAVNNGTKEQIQQLYIEQHAQDAMNRQTIQKADRIPTDLKMVIVVRKDLKMSCGKVAAQCCHGCLGVVMDIMNKQHINTNSNISGNVYDLRLILRLWRMNGEKKIVLQCANEAKLMQLKDQAVIKQLPHYLVCDAGHTQIKSGSKTVLAIGPYPSVDIDQLTKELKLY
eukprot:85337_1